MQGQRLVFEVAIAVEVEVVEGLNYRIY